jgi:hypothetical protein
MSTISPCSLVLLPCLSTEKPASEMIRSAVRDSPTFASVCLICFVPTCMPTATESSTNASQPITAVFQ